MANILITGGSGLVGKAISELFIQDGHKVNWLGRKSGKFGQINCYEWDLEKKYIDVKAFEDIQVLIHLAGAGIVEKAWTPQYKKEIKDSRIKSSELLFEYLTKTHCKLSCFIGSSAVGYYGSETSNHLYTEADAPGTDFLSETCIDWEKSYTAFKEKGIRTCSIRTGIVLSNKGGAYTKMLPAFQLGLGAAIGKGTQAFPWIHMKDLAGIYLKAVEDEKMNGAYNAVADERVTNKEFSKALSSSLKKVFFLPNIPEFMMNAIMGERAMTVCGGVKIDNSKIKNTGYTFSFPRLNEALSDLATK